MFSRAGAVASGHFSFCKGPGPAACRHGAGCWRPGCHFLHEAGPERVGRLQALARFWQEQVDGIVSPVVAPAVAKDVEVGPSHFGSSHFGKEPLQTESGQKQNLIAYEGLETTVKTLTDRFNVFGAQDLYSRLDALQKLVSGLINSSPPKHVVEPDVGGHRPGHANCASPPGPATGGGGGSPWGKPVASCFYTKC